MKLSVSPAVMEQYLENIQEERRLLKRLSSELDLAAHLLTLPESQQRLIRVCRNADRLDEALHRKQETLESFLSGLRRFQKSETDTVRMLEDKAKRLYL